MSESSEIIENPELPSSLLVEIGSDLRRVEKSKIEEVVSRYAEFYDVPQEAIDRGLHTDCFIVDNHYTFSKILERYTRMFLAERMAKPTQEIAHIIEPSLKMLGSSLEEDIERRKERIIQDLWAEAHRVKGVCLPTGENKCTIFVRDHPNMQNSISHEILHAMTYFEPDRSGFTDRGTAHSFNEATTTLLELAERYRDHLVIPSLPKNDQLNLLEKIKGGEIAIPYNGDTQALLGVIMGTALDGDPIILKEISKYYFDNDPLNRVLLEMEILKRVSSEVMPQVQSLLRRLTK